ncbi:translocation/assembly module TamB domain-containing protein [Aquifex pyrophilus]
MYIENLTILFGSKEKISRVNILRASLVKGRLKAFVKYDNFKNFYISFYGEGVLEKDNLNLNFLTMNSHYFSAYIKGSVQNNTLNARYKVFINPIKEKRFYMKLIKIEGKAYGKFPKINLEGEGYIPEISVNRRSYRDIFVNINGFAELFSNITLVFNGKGEENLQVWGKYDVIPEGILEFTFENLPVDSYALNVPLKLNAIFKGNGKLNLKKKEIYLFARSKKFSFEDNIFNVYLSLNYKIKSKGVLLFLGENKGKLMGFLEFGKKINGYVKLIDLEHRFKGLNFQISGDFTFKKKDIFSSDLNFRVKNIEYSHLYFPDLRIYGHVYGKNINLSLKSEETYGRVIGSPENLKGFISIKDYEVSGIEKKLFIKRGFLNLSFKRDTILVKGSKISSEFSFKQIKAVTETSFDFLKNNQKINLSGGGVSHVYISGKEILRNFKNEYSLKEGIFSLLGNSKEAKIKVVYDLEKKLGKFEGRYLKEKLRIFTKGDFRDKKISLKIRSSYILLDEKIELEASLKGDEDVINFEVLPYTYRGKKLDVELKGVKGSLINGDLSISFKGLYVRLLDRNLLSLHPVKAKGSIRNFLIPIKISGVYRGVLNIGFLNEPILVSSGFLDLDLLSAYVGSLMRSKLRGELLCSIVLKGKEFSFVATTEKPVKGVSRFFYQPFNSAIHVELDNGGIRFSQVSLFREGYLNLYAFSKDFKNFEVKGDFKNLPIGYRDSVKLRLEADGKINVGIKNFKRINIVLKSDFDGYARIEKMVQKKGEKKKIPLDIFIDAEFKTRNNFVVYLPEGRVYTNVNGKVYGKLPDIFYNVNVLLRAGILNYFGKTFFLREGRINAMKSEEGEITKFNLELHTVEDNYKIFLSLKGTPENPEVFYFSEPPLSRREILLRLIGGSVQESVLPVDKILQNELRTVGFVKSEIERLLDVKLDFGLITSSTGEVGAVLKLKKDIGRFLSVYYQTSSSEDKRDTYLGGEVRFPTDMNLGFRFYLYSDNTREYRLRYIKEFDF